jgi:hypothetical protein
VAIVGAGDVLDPKSDPVIDYTPFLMHPFAGTWPRGTCMGGRYSTLTQKENREHRQKHEGWLEHGQ